MQKLFFKFNGKTLQARFKMRSHRNQEIFLFVFLTLVFVSCRQTISIDEHNIDKLSEGDFKLPSKYGFYNLFFLSENHQIGRTNVNTLQYVYVTFYSKNYKNFKLFLSDVLNQKILIPKKNVEYREVDYLTLDDRISKDYKNLTLNDFISKYVQKSEYDDSLYILKRKYRNDDNLFTILYFLFINNYWISFDNGIGEFVIAQ